LTLSFVNTTLITIDKDRRCAGVISRATKTISSKSDKEEDFGLQTAGKSIGAVENTVSRIKQFTNAVRRLSQRAAANTRHAVSSITTTARIGKAGAAAATTATSTTNPFGWVTLSLGAVVLLFMMAAVVVIVITVMISSAGALAAAGDGFYWPLETQRYVASGYGPREPMYIDGKWTGSFHFGIDIPAPEGTPIGASAFGTVVIANDDDNGGYGKYVMIIHEDGYASIYGHMSSVNVVKGDEVVAMEIIGEVGNTGLSKGPHIHFEVYLDGVAIDPENDIILKDWD